MKLCLIVALSAIRLLMNTNGFASANNQLGIYFSQSSKHKLMINDTMNMVLTRVFDATPEQVWEAWTSEELIKQWWGPKGFTCPVAKIEFREGGTSLVCMRAPKEFGGMDMYNTWSYQRIEPMKRIDYVLNFTDKDGNKLDPAAIGMPPGIPKDVPHFIIFKPLGDNKTELTVTEYGYTSAAVVELSRSGMAECLDKIAAIFAKKQ